MSGIVRLFTDRHFYSKLGKTYFVMGVGVGIIEAKVVLDESTTRADHPIDKFMNGVFSVMVGGLNGIVWPMTLYGNYHRKHMT